MLVDALDEVRYHRSSQTLLDWLCGAPELPANVRFVLTSRPEEELLAVLRAKQAQWLRTVEISNTDPRVHEDSRRYVDGLLPAQLVTGDEALAEVTATFPARRSNGPTATSAISTPSAVSWTGSPRAWRSPRTTRRAPATARISCAS